MGKTEILITVFETVNLIFQIKFALLDVTVHSAETGSKSKLKKLMTERKIKTRLQIRDSSTFQKISNG